MFLSDDVLQVDGVRFEFGSPYGASTDDAFYLAKPDDLTRDYLALAEGAEGNIVELGIFQGGSAALMALVAKPARIVVIDLCEPVELLDRFIAERSLDAVLRPHYGVDQADRPALAAIMDDEFGDERLDLVIDDASHALAPTRASFEELFPRLRPGGRYLIEDWHWEVRFGFESLGDADAPDAADKLGKVLGITDLGAQVLAILGMELVAAHACSPDLISRVSFDGWWIIVERGPAEIDPDGFRLMDAHRGVASLLLPDPGQIPTGP